MYKHNLQTPAGELYINLSEQLRFKLEAKIDDFSVMGKLKIYLESDFTLKLVNDEFENIFFCLKDKSNRNSCGALTICKAIKIWYGMYYDDRLSVLSKFNYLYKSNHKDKTDELNAAHLRFVAFFIIEFSKILVEIRWTLLNGHGYD